MYKIEVRPSKRAMHSLNVDVSRSYAVFNFKDDNTASKTYGERVAYPVDTLSGLVIGNESSICELNGATVELIVEDIAEQNAKRLSFTKKTDDKITKFYENSFILTNLQWAHIKRVACELQGFKTYLAIHDPVSHACITKDEYLKEDYIYEDEEEDYRNIEYNKLTQHYGIDISLKNHRQLVLHPK